MEMSLLTIALIGALVYLLVSNANCLLPNVLMDRPIVIGTILGIILGDPTTGIILGAELELIFMGIISIGVTSGVSNAGASVICVIFAIISGLSTEEAVALAFPLGAAVQVFKNFDSAFAEIFQPMLDRFLEEDNQKMYSIWIMVTSHLRLLPSTAIVFCSIYFGSDFVQGMMDNLPAFVTNGLNAFGSIMPALGMAMMLSLIWNRKIAILFVLGFFVTIYTNINVLFLTIIAVAIAVMDFFWAGGKAAVPEAVSDADSEKEDFLG